MGAVKESLLRMAIEMTELTKLGELNWTKAVKSNRFQTSMVGLSVQVWEREARRHEEGSDYGIDLYRDGELLDSVVDTDFADVDVVTLVTGKPQTMEEIFGLDDKPTAMSILKELYDIARRQALGTDTAVHNILTHLSSLKKKPK